jgi:hypothetical protein
MKRLTLGWLSLAVLIVGSALTLPAQGTAPHSAGATKPIAADKFPTGQDIPEGAAADIARALINRDEQLFSKTCVRLYARGAGPAAYAQFLQQTIQNIREEAKRTVPSPGGPKSIEKVFAARHLSNGGPASYGYASFGFQDVMFVDVEVLRYDGQPSFMRTLVRKDSDGKWYVHPDPSVSPLLSEGLDDEEASVAEFRSSH